MGINDHVNSYLAMKKNQLQTSGLLDREFQFHIICHLTKLKYEKYTSKTKNAEKKQKVTMSYCYVIENFDFAFVLQTLEFKFQISNSN